MKLSYIETNSGVRGRPLSAKIKMGSTPQIVTQQRITVICFLVIPLFLLFLFTYLPLFDMIRYSFYKWDGYSQMKFIGLDNYTAALTQSEYWAAFRTSTYYFVGSIVQIAVALFFSTIFCFKMRGRSFFKGILFFPSLMNGVAIGFVFLYFFKGGGTLDTVLAAFGVPPESIPLWLGNVNLINISLTFVSVWRYMGQNMVMFSGATESISGDYFEAAEIDGANRWHLFWYIILPNIRGVVALNLILAIKGAISVYETPFVMTRGSGGSMTYVIKTLHTAFTSRKIGLACALGVILLIMVLFISLIQKRFVEGKEEKK